MAIVAFINQKGGVGKTTLNLHWAWYRAAASRRVCVVDTDAQGNATDTLAEQAVAGVTAIDLFREPVEVPMGEGPVALVPADKTMRQAETETDAIEVFQQNIGRIAGRYDDVVIDTAPAFGVRMTAVLAVCTHALIPIEMSPYSIDGAQEMLGLIGAVQQQLGAEVMFSGFLASRVNPNDFRQKNAFRELQATFPDLIVPRKITMRSAFEEAVREKKPVWGLSGTSAKMASAEIRAVFDLVAQKIED